MTIDVFEAIHTARAFRKFKPDPVPDSVIEQILDAAIRAPSAGNAQGWIFLVVRDPEQRRKLGAIYRKASDIADAMYAATHAGAETILQAPLRAAHMKLVRQLFKSEMPRGGRPATKAAANTT